MKIGLWRTGLATALWAFIDAWVFSTQNRASETAGLQLFLGAFYLSMTLLGAWSSLYYAINFYLASAWQCRHLHCCRQLEGNQRRH